MDLSKIYPPRPTDAHKGNYGSVLVVCGSKLYSGAATFASIGALRAGADLVTLCAPERAANVAANHLFDLMTFPLKGDEISTKNIPDILDCAHLRKVNSAVVGCGLGRKVTTFAAIYKLIEKLNVPMVLDADALRAIAKSPEAISGKQAILTPHLGELAILLGQREISNNFEAKLTACKQAAQKYHAVVLLKGAVDIISDGTSTITSNSGCPFMTKGGTGDILAGICGALLARGVGLFEAAHFGAYINGRAGELAGDKFGEGMVASDMLGYIPRVIRT